MNTEYPEQFQIRIQKQLGDQAEAFWETLTQNPPREGLRVNTLKLSPAEFEKRSPFSLRPLPWTQSGYLLENPRSPGKHPYHTAGLYYLQEPSAMAVPEISPPAPGDLVLDIAAAPGGKSTHLASLMNNQGLLIANDPHGGRVQALSRNLERWGARNAVVTCEKPGRLAEHWGPIFDRVYVDAPCSGEGMFRRSPGERKLWSPNLIKRSAAVQNDLLWKAARLVRPGGQLIYSTCTFAPLENEGTIARFLEAREDFQIQPLPDRPGFTPGVPAWGKGRENLRKTVHIWPHLSPGEGHFLALLERSPAPEKAPGAPSWAPQPIQGEARTLYEEFFFETFHPDMIAPALHPGSECLVQFGQRLYLLPRPLPHLAGLHIIHWGWWIGTFKSRRFEPAHALAMGLKPEAAHQEETLTLQDPETLRFIRGLPLTRTGPEGWVLVHLDAHPLGWGKRSQGQIKSNIPRWLRNI